MLPRGGVSIHIFERPTCSDSRLVFHRRKTRRGGGKNTPPPVLPPRGRNYATTLATAVFSQARAGATVHLPAGLKKWRDVEPRHAVARAWFFFRVGRDVSILENKAERSAPAASGKVGSPRAVRKRMGLGRRSCAYRAPGPSNPGAPWGKREGGSARASMGCAGWFGWLYTLAGVGRAHRPRAGDD